MTNRVEDRGIHTMSLGARANGRRSPRNLLAAGCVALMALLAPQPVQGTEAPAEQGEIIGTVTREDDGTPVSGVLVRAELPGGEEVVTWTDGEGRFELSGLPTGEVVVTVEHLGLEDGRREVVVRNEDPIELDLALPSAPLAISGLTASATGEERRITETAAAVGLIDADAIDQRRASHPGELLGQVPGAHVNVAGGGEGHMTAIRQPLTTDPVYLFLEDGVPTRSTGFFNHNALYEVNLPQAGGVEVMKGPATALHGSDAIGGVINVSTRAPSESPEVRATAEAGGDGFGRLLASAANTWSEDGLRADLNLTRSDGWRDETGYDRQSGTVRWDRTLGGDTKLKTVATFSRISQDAGGTSPLSRSDFEDDPTQNLRPIGFRDVRALRFSTELEQRSERSRWSVVPFVRHNRMELLPDWALTFDPTVWETEHSSVGLMARGGRDVDALEARLTAGVDVDYSPGGRRERAIDPVEEEGAFVDYAPGELLYDYDVSFAELSPHVQAEAMPTPGLHLSAGLRADFLRYGYETHLSPLAEGSHRRPEDTTVRYAHVSPNLGVTYDLTPAHNVFASFRHGFRAPSENQLFRQGRARNTVDLDPVKANSFELGARGRLAGRLTYEVTGYHMPKSDDIVDHTHPDGTPETQNAGETLHRGIELGAGLEVMSGVRLDVAYAYQRHTYEEWRPEEDVDLAGNEMEFAPREVGNATLTLDPTAFRGGTLGLEWSRVGSYWKDAANSERYAGHDLLNLRADLPLPRGLTLFGRLTNATDERYAERAAYNEFRGAELAPGRPRTLFVGLDWGVRP